MTCAPAVHPPAPASRSRTTQGVPGTGTGLMPPVYPSENPFQVVTISDKQRPRPSDVRTGQCPNPTTDDKAQTMTVGKRGLRLTTDDKAR
jgi:hypothetical protein